MKTFVICTICKSEIKKAHGYEHGKIMAAHIYFEHPEAYLEIAKVSAAVEQIEEKYKIYARDFFYYELRNYIEKQ